MPAPCAKPARQGPCARPPIIFSASWGTHPTFTGFQMLQSKGSNLINVGPFFEAASLDAVLSELAKTIMQAGGQARRGARPRRLPHVDQLSHGPGRLVGTLLRSQNRQVDDRRNPGLDWRAWGAWINEGCCVDRGDPLIIPTLVGLFVSRYALVSQKALVSRVVHLDTAFLAGRAIRGCLGHGDFVFSSASAFMRAGEPFSEFCHARKMRCRWQGTQHFQSPIG